MQFPRECSRSHDTEIFFTENSDQPVVTKGVLVDDRCFLPRHSEYLAFRGIERQMVLFAPVIQVFE